MSESGFPDFLEFSSVNLTNIAGIVHCCGKIPADRKSFEIIKTLAIRRLQYFQQEHCNCLQCSCCYHFLFRCSTSFFRKSLYFASVRIGCSLSRRIRSSIFCLEQSSILHASEALITRYCTNRQKSCRERGTEVPAL